MPCRHAQTVRAELRLDLSGEQDSQIEATCSCLQLRIPSVSDFTWANTYALKLPVVLTDNLEIEEGVLPPGERIERGKKATKRKAAGRRAQTAPEVTDYYGVGSQAFRGEEYEPTGRNYGYSAIGKTPPRLRRQWSQYIKLYQGRSAAPR